MYVLFLILPLFYGMILAALALVPGLMALALAFATAGPKPKATTGPQAHERPPSDTSGCLGVVHGLSTGGALLLLSASCGFAGAGLFSVLLNLVLMAVALISYSISPTAGGDLDPSVGAVLYFGTLFVAFLAFFALGMDRLGRRLFPEGGGGGGRRVKHVDHLRPPRRFGGG
jgi:hypothetical protein